MNNNDDTFTYEFSLEELKAIALLVRGKEDKIPKRLFSFVRAVQSKLYSSLSIDEMEKFYQR